MNDDRLQQPSKEDQEVRPGAPCDAGSQNRSKLSAAGGALIAMGGLIGTSLALIGPPGPRTALMGLLIFAAATIPIFWCAGLGQSRRFHIGVAAMLALTLSGVGVYVRFGPTGNSYPASAQEMTARDRTLPHLAFADPPQMRVPWCSHFYLTETGAIPIGYKLVVFATGADVNWRVRPLYLWTQFTAAPVSGRHGEWITQAIHFGPMNKPARSGPQLKPVVYAGYHGVVVAELLTDQMSNSLAGSDLLKKLPFSRSVTTLHVIRNGETAGC
jgi:hypothetical protein